MRWLLIVAFSGLPVHALKGQQDSLGRDPDCATLYALHRADPYLAVDSEPRLRIFIIPPEGRPRGRAPDSLLMSVVVDTSGTPLVETLQLEPGVKESYRREYIKRLRGWQFYPARVNGCTVPSRYVQRFRVQ